MKKLLIFAAGMVVGAAVGTVVTVLCYQKEKEKNKEKVTEKPEDHNGALVMDEEELADYYIQQLRDLGCVIIDDDREHETYEYYMDAKAKAQVNPVEEEETDDYLDETDEFTPIEVNPVPYEITDHEHGQKEFYSCETLMWYRGDRTMTDDNYELLDDWQMHIGDVEERLMTSKGDSLYFRNESQQTDYEVLIYDESYKHAVEGEDDDLGDMAD